MGCNKAPTTEPVTQAPPITVGAQVDDAVITSSVRSALLADSTIKSFDLQVETRRGTVLRSEAAAGTRTVPWPRLAHGAPIDAYLIDV
ncbi:MAG: hypothetical protein Q8K45_00010 [Rubrivivax sp.]|nr:hypothetical protein [Rubrivivax sp.]